MDKRTIPCTTADDDPSAGLPPAELPLTLVLTCTDCDNTYEPSAGALATGRLGCPDPDCLGWTFSSALTVPTTRTQGGAA